MAASVKICWWTPIPTTNQSALAAGLRAAGAETAVCYFRHYDSYRREALGWIEPPRGADEHFVPTVTAARRDVPGFEEAIHAVPGYWGGTVWRLVAWCVWHRRPWYLVTEGARGGWATWPFRKAMAVLANRHALGVFAIGRRACDQFVALGVRPEKVHWTAYATPETPPARQPDALSATTFVYSGSLCARKATDVLARAWQNVHADFPAARLRVAGDGPMRELLASLPGVEMLGTVPPEEIAAVFEGAQVIVLPSRYDPWGVALAEGAMAGLAMIASDRTGAKDLVEPGVNGRVVPAEDAEALAAAMREYAADPQKARREGERARTAALRTRGTVLAAEMVALCRRFSKNEEEKQDA